jgi:predicted nucleic acid-binding protein
MTRIVIDASIALSWCFADERSDSSQKLLENVILNGALVPNLWHLEVCNSLLIGEIKGRITVESIVEQFKNFDELPIEVDLQTSHAAWGTIARIARNYKLTSYDAAYVELAQRHSIALATRDKAMIKAARSLKIPLFEQGQ